ncbi:hypothetical protein BDV32DRAFT_14343 [Aspergillus pseudonomiae]|nr:hypothetical protein BDV32DRAFT_14343 [Aspergillus pseudonomiae]
MQYIHELNPLTLYSSLSLLGPVHHFLNCTTESGQSLICQRPNNRADTSRAWGISPHNVKRITSQMPCYSESLK